MQKLARNTKSCQKVAEQLVASPRIGHSRAENYILKGISQTAGQI